MERTARCGLEAAGQAPPLGKQGLARQGQGDAVVRVVADGAAVGPHRDQVFGAFRHLGSLAHRGLNEGRFERLNCK